MGLISFIKDAGKKIFGRDEDEKAATAAATTAEARRAYAQRRAEVLEREIRSLGLDVHDFKVDVDGGTARISGTAKTQAEREKAVLAVGNVHGIETVDDRLEVEHKEAEATYYTVKSGDTLSKIAKEHYGNAMKYPKIFEANKPMLKDPDKIYPGQKLRIPALDD